MYIACGYTDLRKGIDGLATLVQSQFQLDPFTNTLCPLPAKIDRKKVKKTE